jgi:hypothetical protein
LLKLYLWGYLNAVRSTRALERECHRDVECMWLLGRLAPDHKTIAEFRRTNTAALVAACAGFVDFARRKRLIGGATVAIDGTKIRAVASRKAVLHEKELIEQARRNAEQIEEYLQRLDAQDKQEDNEQARSGDVQRALKQLQDQQQEIQAHVERLQQARGTTAVMGEPDAQVMGHASNRAPAYNLQTAVESQSHLIVAQSPTKPMTSGSCSRWPKPPAPLWGSPWWAWLTRDTQTPSTWRGCSSKASPPTWPRTLP